MIIQNYRRSLRMGFVDIGKPGMPGSAGRFMSVKKNAAMKRIYPDTIKRKPDKQGMKSQDDKCL